MKAEHERPSEQFVRTSFQERLQDRELQHGIKPAVDLVTQADRERQYDRLEGMIGNTPLLQFDAPNGSRIFAKDESENPTESHYDRVYVRTLRELEKRGIIKPGDDLWEVTSGSAGISFAWACSRIGYNAMIFVPTTTPIGRTQEMINFGANLVQTNTGSSVPEASKTQQREFVRAVRARGMRPKIHDTQDGMFHLISATSGEDQPGMHIINHSENHFTHHAVEEIGEEVAGALAPGTQLNFFVSILGNGTNTRGITDGLKKTFGGFKVIGVEADNQPVQFVAKYPGVYEERYGDSPTFDKQLLLGSSQKGTTLSFMDLNMIDEIRLVSREQWQSIQQRYNEGKPREETLGRTSGASFAVSEELDKECPNSVMLLLIHDKDDRYDKLVRTTTPAKI